VRYGIIADLHANLPALEKVLAHLDRERIDGLVCLGDLVGYGPHPDEVVAMVAEREIPTVVGNHDLVAAGLDDLDRCGEDARATLAWTRATISASTRDFLRALPHRLELDGGIVAAHGSIDDPWRYVRRLPDVLEQLDEVRRLGLGSMLLLAHTHRQMVVDETSRKVATSEGLLARRRRTVAVKRPAFVNPGAVGQSRELRQISRCAILDTASGKVHLYSMRYPYERCADDLRRRDLPPEWCHARPSVTKVAKQTMRDAQDRRYGRWKGDRFRQRVRS